MTMTLLASHGLRPGFLSSQTTLAPFSLCYEPGHTMACNTDVSEQPFSLQLTTESLFSKCHESSTGHLTTMEANKQEVRRLTSAWSPVWVKAQKLWGWRAKEGFFISYPTLQHKQFNHPLTFDTYLHQSIPLSTAVAQQAESTAPTGHNITGHTSVQQLISHVVSRVLL